MTKISAAEVNQLRKQTGAGMMDCKAALIECDGDIEKAIDFLRKKGQKVATKRADRDSSEGVVIAKTNADKTYAAVIMVNCETDFVAKNEDFINYVNSIINLAIENKASNVDELKELDLNGRKVGDTIIDQTGVIGEKIELGKFEVIEDEQIYAYNHQGNRLAAIVGFNKVQAENIEQIGTEIAMQIAAMAPLAVDKSDIDPSVIEHEKEIGKEQARLEGKAEDLLEKIAMGKLNKFFKENTLLNQNFIRENKKTVKQYLAEVNKDLKVNSFKRVMLEGK